MYIPLKFENKFRRRALIDTGACANAMPADFDKKLKEESPYSISELQQASFLNVKVASGQTVKVLAQVDVKLKVNDHNFQDSFLILPSMNSVVLGNPFFRKYNIEISPGENLLKLPEITYQLNEIRIPKEVRRKIPQSRYNNVLVGCEVPRLDLLKVICSTTLQAIEEMVSFADL